MLTIPEEISPKAASEPEEPEVSAATEWATLVESIRAGDQDGVLQRHAEHPAMQLVE